jgi:hypothetical protein
MLVVEDGPMRSVVKLKLSTAQVITASVMIITLASISYQLYLLRKKTNKELVGADFVNSDYWD